LGLGTILRGIRTYGMIAWIRGVCRGLPSVPITADPSVREAEAVDA
jgi:hypothetical protein